jgi:hypothetical protein
MGQRNVAAVKMEHGNKNSRGNQQWLEWEMVRLSPHNVAEETYKVAFRAIYWV